MTIADIAIFPWTRTYYNQGVDLADYPNVEAWRTRMFSHEAVQVGMKVGAEWREDLSKLTGADWDKMFGMDKASSGS